MKPKKKLNKKSINFIRRTRKRNKNYLKALYDNTKLDNFVSNISAIIEELSDNKNELESTKDQTNGTSQDLDYGEERNGTAIYSDYMSEDPFVYPPPSTEMPNIRLRRKKISIAIQPAECANFKKIENPSISTDDDEDNKNVITEYYTSETGGHLNMTCLTVAPHEWRSTAHGFDPNHQIQWYEYFSEIENLNVEKDLEVSSFTHFSTLRLANLSHEHVGEYTCRTTGIAIQEKLFLFVNDPDHPSSISKSQSPLTVLAEIGKSVHIPCVPSHPDFKVVLKRETFTMNSLYSFSPDSGFFIPEVTGKNMSGKYECLFTSIHKFEQRVIINLFVEPSRNRSRGGASGYDIFGDNADSNEGSRGAISTKYLGFQMLTFNLFLLIIISNHYCVL